MSPIKYLLFDCDNTLCLSEKLAFEACSDLTNELLQKHKIDAHYSVHDLLENFVGQNFRGMMNGLQAKHHFKMSDDQMNEYVGKELGAVTAKLREKCQPCEGAPEQVEAIYKAGKIPIAVVSTSAKPRVVASLEKTDLMKYFKDEHVYSAATSLNPPSSKPDPKIYNYACEQLGVANKDAVAVEDSKSGATAAMRAGIPLIGYVGVYMLEDGKEKMEAMAKTLTEECGAKAIMYNWSEFPECLKKVEAST